MESGRRSYREDPPIQNQRAINNNRDHHRDSDPSWNIIRTQKMSQKNYCSKNLAFIIPEPH
jgi:hypothetical protein